MFFLGTSPPYSAALSFPELSQQQAVALAAETAASLHWPVMYLSADGLIVNPDKENRPADHCLKVQWKDNELHFTGESVTKKPAAEKRKNQQYVYEYATALKALAADLSPEQLTEKYAELEPRLEPADAARLAPASETFLQKAGSFLALFLPREGYYVTPVLLLLNIAVFVLMVLSGVHMVEPTGQDLITWGANFRPYTLDGGIWRLLTSCFLHIGIFHLALNLYALIFVGLLLEPLLGRLRFASAYLLAGILASLASLWWNSFTISAGASGAIFGMYGVFLALLTTNLVPESERKTLLTSIGIFVGYNLLFGLKDGVDNAAHIGGLVSGIVIGFAFYPALDDPYHERSSRSVILALTVFSLALTGITYKQLPNDILAYDEKMERFATLESLALEVYSIPDTATKERKLHELTTRGNYYWQENLELVKSLEEMDLPEELQQRNELLKTYCQLRLQSNDLLYRSLAEESDAYDAELDACSKQINNLISQLKGEEE